MKLIKKNHKRLTRFLVPMVMTALLCVTSPTLAQIPSILNTAILPYGVVAVMPNIAQNKNISNVSQQAPLGSNSQAVLLYNKKQFAEAAKLFEQSAQAYQTQKNPIQQALSLSNLSLCYQQLGRWDDANRVITQSIKILTTAENAKEGQLSALAQSYDIQGELQLARGQGDAALKSWERVTALYTQQNKPQLVLASQVNQAQALQSLGLYRRAITLLETALKLPSGSTSEEQLLTTSLKETSTNSLAEIKGTSEAKFNTLLQQIPANPETATALHSLGDSLRVVGNLPLSYLVLQRSLTIANQLQLPNLIPLIQLSLGNTVRTQINPDTGKLDPQAVQVALNFYQQVGASASNDLNVQAQVNQLSLLVDTNQDQAAKTLLPQVQQQIEALPKSQTGIEARINLAQTMMQMRKNNGSSLLIRDIAQILAVAVQQAQELGNPRTQAYALGSLGHVYEQTHQWQEAEKLTAQAVQLAQQINAGDISYLWQWQLGRVMKEQGKIDDAIAAYKEAVGTIKALRADLAAASPNVQFSFRDAVEPIHRQLVTLLVQSSEKDNDKLKTARDVIEGLQLVELDNFFREACLSGNPEQVDQVDRRAAVIYPIILEDQLAIIVSLPKSQQESTAKDNRNYRYYKSNVTRKEIEDLASSLQEKWRQDTALDFTLPILQRMYDLVLRPEAADLAASKVETLVFVSDGVLRNIPMAALYDGKQYLVENYSIALTPGLQLLAPRSRNRQNLGALVAALSESRLDFKALPNVKDEVKNIESEIPTQVLLNQKFTNSAFKSGVSAASYPIVHLATHGQFSSKPEETFILTWDGKIRVNELSGVLKTVQISRNNALELLVLSACETAAGDTRSALGLAGVAVRSGARSTVATLWRVNDEASAMLVSEFYNQLVQAVKTNVSKAEALRRAQVSILKNPKYQSPYYWAAYVLLGNWV